MSINWPLLPLKAHYGLFNSAMGSLVPNLPTYARQLGYSPATIGTIYSILPVFGLIAKPLFGFLADRYKAHKSILIFFQILILLTFVGIPFVHITEKNVERSNPVELECHDNEPVLTACYPTETVIDQCKINRVGHMNNSITCKMNCNMTNSGMWQHNCDASAMRSMCISQTDSFLFTPNISKVNRPDCFMISPREILSKGFGGSPFKIGCTQNGLNENCKLECNGTKLLSLIVFNRLSFTCVENSFVKILLCNTDFMPFYIPSTTKEMGICKVKCKSNHVLSVIDYDCSVSVIDPETSLCRDGRSALEFKASIAPSSIIVDDNCLSLDFKHIIMGNDIQHLTCPNSKEPRWTKEYNPQCNITCENNDVNTLIASAAENTESTISSNKVQFWIFSTLLALSWIGQAVVVTFSDAICFDILGPNSLFYGKQRLWGSAGWGIFSLITGVLIDRMSDGVTKDYTVSFIIMAIFLILDTAVVAYFMKVQSPHVSINILRDVGTMVSSWATGLFFAWSIPVGICTGLLWQFHFFLIEDVANLNCEDEGHVKTIQGLVNAIQMFGGEIPAMFVSGCVLNKLGHHNMMSLILFGFSLRYILYSSLYNAWWFLPIEVLQGLTIGMIYPTMASYAHVVAPRGTEATVQGLVGAIFEGVGASLGSYIGGHLYGAYGGWLTFRYFGYFAFTAGVLHAVVILILKKKDTLTVPPGCVLNKLGHHNMMTLILFGFSLRYILYSSLYNAWWFLPIEVLQGCTIGMIYPTMASYAHVVAPRGTEATVQGLVGAIFEGVGASLGSYIGGHLYGVYGGWLTFRYFGYFAFTAGVLHAVVILILKKKDTLTVPPEMVPVVAFIRRPEDMHRIFGDEIGYF